MLYFTLSLLLHYSKCIQQSKIQKSAILFTLMMRFILSLVTKLWVNTESESEERSRQMININTLSCPWTFWPESHQIQNPMIPRLLTTSSNYVFCFHCFVRQILSSRKYILCVKIIYLVMCNFFGSSPNLQTMKKNNESHCCSGWQGPHMCTECTHYEHTHCGYFWHILLMLIVCNKYI